MKMKQRQHILEHTAMCLLTVSWFLGTTKNPIQQSELSEEVWDAHSLAKSTVLGQCGIGPIWATYILTCMVSLSPVPVVASFSLS